MTGTKTPTFTRLLSLLGPVRRLQQEVAELNTRIGELTTRIGELTTQNAELTTRIAELATDNRAAWDACAAARAELQAATSEAQFKATQEKLNEQASLIEGKDAELRLVHRDHYLRGELTRKLTRAALAKWPLVPNAAATLVLPNVANPSRPPGIDDLVREEIAAAEQNVPASVRIPVLLAWGDVMIVVLPEKVSSIIAADGLYEADVTDALIRILQPGDTFFDVGAHYGYFSLLAARLVGSTGHVLSFEPTRATRQILEINTRSLTQITLRSEAIWSSEGRLPFNENIDMFSAFNSMLRPRLDDITLGFFAPTATTVQTTTLDAVVASTGLHPRLVKIDAESAEGEILSGASSLLQRQRPVVILELGDLGVEGATESRGLVDRMMGHGYCPFEHFEGHWRPHQPRQTYEFANVVFAPAECVRILQNDTASHTATTSRADHGQEAR